MVEASPGKERPVGNKVSRMLLAAAVLAVILPSVAPEPVRGKDPDTTRVLTETLNKRLDAARYEHKRQAALLGDISDEGWAGFPMGKDDEAWRKVLDARTYRIAREKKDEMEVPNPDLHLERGGALICGACGAHLFDADAAVASSEPGLHFGHAHAADAVVADRNSEWSLEAGKVELLCGACGGHLGYVDAGEAASDPLRFVVNPGVLSRAEDPASTPEP